MMLVTGGTGFLGRQIVRAARERGIPVRLVTRKHEEETGVERLLTQDMFLESQDWWKHALDGVDTVIHAAWYAEPGKCLTSTRNLDCLHGTLTLARACAQSRVRRFVGIGTCFEYDLEQGLLDVSTPLRPATLYAASKASAFLTLQAYFATTSVSFAWARPFYLFGEGEDARRLFPYLHQRLAAGQPAELTRGTQIRDYLDVTEAGRMICELAEATATGPTNICSGVPVTVRQMAENIADQYGRRDLLRFGVRPDNLTDPACVVGRVFQKTSDAH
jgi:nucleoside-diphosphate-sugar epimerase